MRNKLNIFNIGKFLAVAGGICLAAVFLLSISNMVLAQGPDLGIEYAEDLNLPDRDPRIAAVELLRLLISFIGIIAVIFVIYAGFLWMTAAGSEDKVSRAKSTLKNAIIGLIIILSAFLIVSFVINRMNRSLNGGDESGDGGGNRTARLAGGFGALGNCAIESVYPAPFQADVPRNTSIVVTFREGVATSSIINGVGKINADSVKIFKSNDEATLITEVYATTTDNRTFVLTPVNYLGSPLEISISYTVQLTDEITNMDGAGIFRNCSDEKYWEFNVSNRIDLTAPQVVLNQVYPLPDNEEDEVSATAATAATGTITVASNPYFQMDAEVILVATTTPVTPRATATADVLSQQGGVFVVTVAADNITARLESGAISLGSAVFNGRAVQFPDYFSLTVEDDISAGNQWRVTMVAARPADTLTVGDMTYIFVTSVAGLGEILIGDNITDTAVNIRNSLSTNSSVNVATSGAVVMLSARVAGTAGNSIHLSAAAGTRLVIVPLAGGSGSDREVDINGAKDEPRNTIIQINFDESMNPLTLSGAASSLRNFLRVVNAAAGAAAGGTTCASDASCLSYDCDVTCQGNSLAGKFVMSNQYKTVEFYSDTVCGVNGCGELIYCLPPNSHLKVEIYAAGLAGCENCAGKTPFNACIGAPGHCADTTVDPDLYHPLSASPLSGAADMAMNSLDGDRQNGAEGPSAFYNENNDSGDGDNYTWSFYINDQIDAAAPSIESHEPSQGDLDTTVLTPVRITFDKLMMSSSLKTGSRIIDNGLETTEHKMVNIWNFTQSSVGYWTTTNNLDTAPLDGFPDATQAVINHTPFADTTSYRTQVGSGVKDIHQNCFNPSSGPDCTAGGANRSCCPDGTGAIVSTSTLNNGNCP